MSLKFGSTEVEAVKYNGVALDKVIYNGVTVWMAKVDLKAYLTSGNYSEEVQGKTGHYGTGRYGVDKTSTPTIWIDDIPHDEPFMYYYVRPNVLIKNKSTVSITSNVITRTWGVDEKDFIRIEVVNAAYSSVIASVQTPIRYNGSFNKNISIPTANRAEGVYVRVLVAGNKLYSTERTQITITAFEVS